MQAVEMAQWLRALTAPPEILSSTPSNLDYLFLFLLMYLSHSLDLELQALVGCLSQVLGIQLQSSGRIATGTPFPIRIPRGWIYIQL